MCPFSTVTDPNGRRSAIACAESAVPQPQGSQIVHSGMWASTTTGVECETRARSLVIQAICSSPSAASMPAALIEAVPRPPSAIVIEKLEIPGHAFVDRVVFPRDGMYAIDTDFLQQLACLAEFIRLRQVAHVAGVHD